jgi:hypothetical protein
MRDEERGWQLSAHLGHGTTPPPDHLTVDSPEPWFCDPSDIDRQLTVRAIARLIARMLWDHERRWAHDAAGSRRTVGGSEDEELPDDR